MSFVFRSLAIASFLAQAAASANLLPSTSFKDYGHGSGESTLHEFEGKGSWWVRVEDTVYHQPQPGLGLSDQVSDYYYAHGNKAALTQELRELRVGGSDRVHLFHLPGGPSALKQALPKGSRRSSISMLQRLRTGQTLSELFPSYAVPKSYKNPLSACGVELEKAAISQLTQEKVIDELKLLLDSTPTRSYDNETAQHLAVEFLHERFASMGLAHCDYSFKSLGIKYSNIVAHIPGVEQDAVVMGAHYDSRPFSGPAPGANDNGSGVAALLAIARAVSAAKVKPQKTIFFVAFAGEEIGLLGSENFAQKMIRWGIESLTQCRQPESSFLEGRRARVQTDRQRAIIMDEVGWKCSKLKNHTINLETYDQPRNIDVMGHLAASNMDYNGNDLSLTHSGNPFGSDHMSFLNKQMGAVLTINADDDAYPDYHASTDALKNVDPKLLFMLTKMNLGGLLRLSGAQCQ